VLVLGTLPGEESLRRREYYAHPRNLFWPIVFGLFGASPPTIYQERLRFAIERGIALWDVCGSAERLASADTAIRAEMPNAIPELLQAHPAIRAVAFNGSTARRLHDRHFARRADLVYLALPSTSPAHARLGLSEKLAQWSALRQVLGGG
jgi:double-stranded uracil-DNA glycosylase